MQNYYKKKSIVTKELSDAFKISVLHFGLWHKNIRVIMSFLLTFILCYVATEKYIDYAEMHSFSIQGLESFIWAFGDEKNVLLMSLLVFLLFSDMPLKDNSIPFYLIRVNRRSWMIGQLLYVFASVNIYLLFTAVSTIILSWRYSYAGNVWSEASVALAYANRKNEMFLPVSIKTMEMSYPYETALTMTIFLVCYFMVMVYMFLFFSMEFGSRAGAIAEVVFISYGIILNPENIYNLLNLPEELFYKANLVVGWLSPLNHAVYYMHSFGYDKLPGIDQSIVIFIIILVFLTVFCARAAKKYEFRFDGNHN